MVLLHCLGRELDFKIQVSDVLILVDASRGGQLANVLGLHRPFHGLADCHLSPGLLCKVSSVTLGELAWKAILVNSFTTKSRYRRQRRHGRCVSS